MPNNLKRERNFPTCGRLIVFQSGASVLTNLESMRASTDNFEGLDVINFPAMPDDIELARAAEYTVSTPWGFPDGIHFYKGTSILEIPVSFKLHAFDKEYCPNGVKSLLQIAALLEALVLPIGPKQVPVSYGYRGGWPDGDQTSQAAGAATTTGSYRNPPPNVFPPATCYLELVVTERDGPGIACVGYVKNVKVKLSGPYMRSVVPTSTNLPSNGEFSFTFVHHPGHGNNYNLAASGGNEISEKQAMAADVKDNLFNTVNLMTNPNSFVGINDVKGN